MCNRGQLDISNNIGKNDRVYICPGGPEHHVSNTGLVHVEGGQEAGGLRVDRITIVLTEMHSYSGLFIVYRLLFQEF